MKRSMRRVLAVALGSALALPACVNGDGSAGEANRPSPGVAGEGTTYRVAQIRWDAGDLYFNGVDVGERQAASEIQTETGDVIEFQTVAQNDVEAQVSGLEALIDEGIDGVSLVPWQGEGMRRIVEQLQSEEIPVVIHNLTVPGSSTPFVAFDNIEAGALAGQALVDAIAESRGPDWASEGGVIMILRGDLTASFDGDRVTGYMSVLRPLLDENPNLELVERADLGYQAEPARQAVEEQIASTGAESILAIASVDGTMATGGAIPALKAGGAVVGAGQPDAVAVTSIDCSQPELDAIIAGELTHCSEQPALAEGQLVTRMLYDMMSNGSMSPTEGVEEIPGSGDAPWGPVEVSTRDDIEGNWYKTKAFAVPGQVAPDADDVHWASAGGLSGT